MENLKVGQRIELYMVVDPTESYEHDFIISTIRPGEYMGANLAFVDNFTCSNRRPMYSNSANGFPQEVKIVGAMIVKSLKNK